MTRNVIIIANPETLSTIRTPFETEPEFTVGHGQTRMLKAVHTYARSWHPNTKVYVCLKNDGDLKDLPEDFLEEYREILKYGVFNGVIVEDDNVVTVKNALAVHCGGVDHLITTDREWVLE